MTPFEHTIKQLNEDSFIKKLVEIKYGRNPIVLVIGPPKSGTTWLNSQLWKNTDNVGLPPTKDSELLSGLVQDDQKSLENTIKLFAKKTKDRIKQISSDVGPNGITNLLAPVLDILNTTEFINLYSLFFSPYVMRKNKENTNSFFYIDVSLCRQKVKIISRIKKFLLMIGFKKIKIVMIMRDPADRFISHVFHGFASNGVSSQEPVHKVLESFFVYVNSFLKNRDENFNFGYWIKKHSKNQNLPNWFWSAKIENGSILDDIYEDGKLEITYLNWGNVFEKNNIHCLHFDHLFQREKLQSLFLELGLKGMNTETYSFDEKVGAGKYSYTNANNINMLKKLYVAEYQFMEKYLF